MSPPNSPVEPTPASPAKKFLPFQMWVPVLSGVVVGVVLRILFFGGPGHPYAPMMGSFVLLVPATIGAVTVYIAEKQAPRTWSYYFLAPCIANILFVLSTMAIMIEGIICAILVVPLFAVIGGMSGLVMGVVCRATKWPKQTMYSIVALPLIFGGLEQRLPLPNQVKTVERSLLVAATPEQIWSHLENARDIQPEELNSAWMYRIGVPLPEAGVTEHMGIGTVRHVSMGKGIHFDQIARVWEPNQRVIWTYRFTPDSFPPNALDDHVRIGGEYFDLRDTEYLLTPMRNQTELRIRMSYRVSTQFNWYAQPIAEMLIGNFEDTILHFYANRALKLHTHNDASG